MPTETVTIENAEGIELSGSIEMPAGAVRGAALFAHCFTCTKQSIAAVHVSRALARHGIATLRFDFTGLGGSEGEFGHQGFSGDVDDLVASAGFLEQRFGGPILLVGHSLGGAAVLAGAERLQNVAGVVTIGAPASVPHALKQVSGNLGAIEQDGEGPVDIGGRPFTVSRTFIEQMRSADLLSCVTKLRMPLMVMHSPTDDTVGIENAAKLFEKAHHPKSFVSLEDANHLLTRSADATFVAEMTAGWAHKRFPELETQLPDEGIRVSTGHGRFASIVESRSHHFVADEPRSVGGDGTGPTPYDLLLAALGTCTAMTMKMYADRKGWPLAGTRIELRHERDHQQECDHVTAMEEGKQIQALYREIALLGDELTTEQRAKLIEIADRCPVHRTLDGHLHIHTETAED
ncbi:alpha/beta fold hydrolase [Erythrobacter sp. LQ02-29]|uniref:bifunctional alpha/beta hydrolase/OsmC family protein n=1 Tax=Erythrobacter sp. LQ02-29 TaxID=2920384 RepID=UPI001F4ED366|nr:alpha/beta fold hydrolase [Erythrobacter sp. LQ02-29]MCP9223210.1 alpha/beta fold hydrolase [Erythrobacter sp. LQ02-29]